MLKRIYLLPEAIICSVLFMGSAFGQTSSAGERGQPEKMNEESSATTKDNQAITEATISSRIEKLEEKTSYYKKRTLKKNVKFVRKSSADPKRQHIEGNPNCTPVIELYTHGAAFSEIKLWVTYNLKYALGPNKRRIDVLLRTTSGGYTENYCIFLGNSLPLLTGGGSFSADRFCAFTLNPRDKVTATVLTRNEDTAEPVCFDQTIQFNTDISMTIIDMVRPN